jgi:CheY-like chemotaxis protein
MSEAPGQVLIVEDEYLIAAEIRMELVQRGVCVLGVAAGSEEAVRLAVLHRPSVILMDIHIRGGVDGIEASRAILRHYTPAFIFVSAYPRPSVLEQMPAIRNHAFLLKPFEIEALFDVLSPILTRPGSGAGKSGTPDGGMTPPQAGPRREGCG